MLLVAVGYLWKQYDANRTAENAQLREQVQKERDRNDILLNAVPEIVTIMRELKNAQANQPRP